MIELKKSRNKEHYSLDTELYTCGTLKSCVTEHKNKPWMTWVEVYDEPVENDLDTYFSTKKEAFLAIAAFVKQYEPVEESTKQLRLF